MTIAALVGIAATGAGLGLAYAAAPGAVNAEALRRGLVRPTSALLVELGSLAGDLTWAIVGISGAAVLLASGSLSLLLALIGGAFMVRMAWRGFLDARRGQGMAASSHGDFTSGLVFGIANPVGIGFWAGVAGLTVRSSSPTSLVVFGVAFMVGATSWAFVITLALVAGRRVLGQRLLSWAGLASAVVLGGFGIRLLDHAAELAVTDAK